MKKPVFILLSLISAGLTLAVLPARAADAAEKPAQNEKGPRERIEERLKMLAEKLALTDAQKAQAAAVLKAEGEKLMALREDESRPRREKFKAMREIREEGRAKIRALLTPEQQAKFDAMPKRGPGGPGGGPGAGEN